VVYLSFSTEQSCILLATPACRKDERGTVAYSVSSDVGIPSRVHLLDVFAKPVWLADREGNGEILAPYFRH
jgi:hypothetical protein